MLTLESVKDYLRVTGHEEDDIITSMIDAAKQSIIDRTGKAFVPNDPVWEQAIKLFVAHLFENRAAVSFSGNPVAIPHTLDMWLHEIALRGDP